MVHAPGPAKSVILFFLRLNCYFVCFSCSLVSLAQRPWLRMNSAQYGFTQFIFQAETDSFAEMQCPARENFGKGYPHCTVQITTFCNGRLLCGRSETVRWPFKAQTAKFEKEVLLDCLSLITRLWKTCMYFTVLCKFVS